MSSIASGGEWHARTLRAWQLAFLRFAVTLDNADRLAVLAIAAEMDRLDPVQDGKRTFGFFRKTSAELCAAILQPNEHSFCCANFWHGWTTNASGVCSRQPSKPTNRRYLRSANRSGATQFYGEGFPPVTTRRTRP